MNVVLNELEGIYAANRILSAQEGLAHANIPHLVTFAGNINALDGGANWGSLSSVMRKYGIFDASDNPIFLGNVPLPQPLTVEQIFNGVFQGCGPTASDAENIQYFSFNASISGPRTFILQIKDPTSGNPAIGDWFVELFNRRNIQSLTLESDTKQAGTTQKGFSFNTQQNETYIIRVSRTASSGAQACLFSTQVN